MVLKTRVNMAMMTAYEAKAKPPNAKLPRAHFSDHNVYKSGLSKLKTQKNETITPIAKLSTFSINTIQRHVLNNVY